MAVLPAAASVVELRLVFELGRSGLGKRGLEWCGINLHQRISDVNALSLLIFYFRNLSRYARGQRNGVERRDRAERLDVHAVVTAGGRRGADHHRRNCGMSGAVTSRLPMRIERDQAKDED